MAHVRDQIVLRFWISGLAIRMDIVTKVKPLEREGDNGRILLDEEVVISEPLDDDNDVGGNTPKTISSDFTRFTTLRNGLEGFLAIVLLQEIEKRHLRNEVKVVL